MDEKDIQNIINLWPLIAAGITGIFGAAYAIVKLTKSKKDDEIVKKGSTIWAGIKSTINVVLGFAKKK